MWLLGMHTPAVADLTNETQMSDGPGGEVEDIASGLVVPTLEDKDESEEGDMTPAETSSEEADADKAEADKADAEEAEKPATEKPATEESATDEPVAEAEETKAE